tara:strand:+ start:3033 stop:3266 length:234 start_codon:yes stop_codon:yes gene_type:complete
MSSPVSFEAINIAVKKMQQIIQPKLNIERVNISQEDNCQIGIVEEHNSANDTLDSNTVNSYDQTQRNHVPTYSKNYP